jgi:universal stress protein E
MPFKNRLLVILRAGDQSQPALERGRLIASRLGAQIYLFSDQPPRKQKHEDWLQALADDLKQQGFDVQVKTWGKGNLIENVLSIVRNDDCGLVIKYSDRSNPLAEVLHTPRDWRLMRYIPGPVLIVKQSESWASRPLVATIDADPDDKNHGLLNEKILQMSHRIAAVSASPLHLVSAYPSPMLSAKPDLQSELAISRRYTAYCQALCESLTISPSHLEVAEGPPEILIPAYCKQHNAGLVVMGTVARSGLRGALLGGNTAEAILAQVSADVLAVKPEGYEEILQILFEHSADESSTAIEEAIDD